MNKYEDVLKKSMVALVLSFAVFITGMVVVCLYVL
jgi:hypothetical protein